MEAFHVCGVRFALTGTADADARLSSRELQSATLDMQTGTFHTAYGLGFGGGAGSNASTATLQHAVRALRHRPQFVMQTVELSVPFDQNDADGVTLYHDVRADAALTDVRFTSGVVHATKSPMSSQTSSVFTLIGSATHARTGHGVHLVSTYLWTADQEVGVLGFNALRSGAAGPGQDVGYVALRLAAPSLPAARTFRVYVLTAMQASGPSARDRETVAAQLQRAVLAITASGQTGAQIVSAHAAAWTTWPAGSCATTCVAKPWCRPQPSTMPLACATSLWSSAPTCWLPVLTGTAACMSGFSVASPETCCCMPRTVSCSRPEPVHERGARTRRTGQPAPY